MNKSELTNELSEETTLNKKVVIRVIDSLTRIIVRTLKSGQKVSITGFGCFQLSHRPKRKGINPATGEVIELSEVYVPRFKAGKNFRESVKPLVKSSAASSPVKSTVKSNS